MPQYGALTIPPGLFQGDRYAVWNAESPAIGANSERVGFFQYLNESPGASIEIVFSAAPGNFSIQVQEADTDNNNDYVNITAAVVTQAALGPSGLSCRIDMASTGFKGRFLRLNMGAAPSNAVTTTANIMATGSA